MEIVVGDTIYFSSTTSIGKELWAYTTTNTTVWLVDEINTDFQLLNGVPTSTPLSSNPGKYMSVLVGDVLYFDADGGNDVGVELWALNTSNHTTWQVAEMRYGSGDSESGQQMAYLLGDTIYFSAAVYSCFNCIPPSGIDGTTGQHGVELVAHDTSNGSTWLVEDIYPGTQGGSPGTVSYTHLTLPTKA